MTVSTVANSAWSTTNNVAPTYPTHQVGDRLIMVMCSKPATAIPDTPAGWTLIASRNSTSGDADTLNTGNAKVSLFYRDADTVLTGAPTINVPGVNCMATMLVTLRKTLTIWKPPVYGGNNTNANASSYAVTCTEPRDIAVGDFVLVGTTINKTNTASVWTFTIANKTRTGPFHTTDGAVSTGNHLTSVITWSQITASAGTGTAIAVSMTLSPSAYGPTLALVQGDETLPPSSSTFRGWGQAA